MAPIEWRWKNFASLSPDELYDIISLRERVFVVEQNCVYLDCDGIDRNSWHLSGYAGGSLAAYLRVVMPGIKYKEHALGRVVTAPEARGSGYGKDLTREALARVHAQFGASPIRISAQAYLEKFYGSFGFTRQSEEYLEDGIPHIEMLRKA